MTGRPGGRRIPHDLRVELYRRVRELHKAGVSYRKIQKIVEEEYGVRLSRSNVSYWVRGIHSPLNEPYNHLDMSKEGDLAWIAGMYAGDGSIKTNRKGRFLSLKVKDKELAEAAARRLAAVVGRDKPYAVNRLSDGRYYVQVQSRELVDHLSRRENILSHLDKKPREFIQAFFDCEGSPSGFLKGPGEFGAQIEVSNTDRGLLESVASKLSEIGIRCGVALHHPKGAVFITSRGKAVARRDCHSLQIRDRDSIVRYGREVGFVTPRKRRKLADIVYILTEFGEGRKAAIEWIRRYEYRLGEGRERWFRRKRLLSWEEAEEEYREFLAWRW